MKRLKEFSYGKLNLMLNISGVREDGYHTLETVMQTVSIHDIIDIRLKSKGEISLKCNLPYVPSDDRNIAWKAAKKFCDLSGYSGGIDIDIRKTIPVGGGMAGGSSNAATVLSMLNRMCGDPLGKHELDKAAISLGADVPFCLKRGTYLATGIGEILEKVPDIPACSIVVCKPKISVSSRNAYKMYDENENKEFFDYLKMLKALETGDIRMVADSLGNSFEHPISVAYPEIASLKKRLLDMGAIGAAMTGSGSVVFGIFEDARKAHKAKTSLRMSRYTSYCLQPVSE
ncbi:MAG: 4-(cytidine 5'-diphospho)-2-C-methyl-D-erythritol kinase [Clostridiaceae bacterium]|nr:4-(cytidine 5'-diphospho)-2-C-methyl-D-erythritol kinase [Clostridiaceae bacterium]